MKKTLFVFLLLLSILFISCDPNPKIPTGSIDSINVTPNTGLVDGDPTEFTVVISYTLIDSDQGQISAVFNTGSDVNRYSFGDSEIVSEGSGTITIVTTETPKDWDTEGDFGVFVILDPYPNPSDIPSLDYQLVTLSF